MNLHHYHHIVFDNPLNVTIRSDTATELLARMDAKITQVMAIVSDSKKEAKEHPDNFSVPSEQST